MEANLAPYRFLRIDSYLAKVDDATATGSDWAGRVWVGWRDPFWTSAASVKQVGDGFVPRVGFVRRRGVRQEYGTVGVHVRPASIAWLNEVNPFVEVDYTTDLEGRLLSRTSAASLDVSYRAGGSFGLDLIDDFERLDEPFAVRPDAVVPMGDYAFRTARISAGTSAGPPALGPRRLRERRLLRRAAHHAVALRPVACGLPSGVRSTPPSATRSRCPRAEDFAANVYGMRAMFAASTRFFTSAFVQYNALTEEVVTNVRIDYVHAPLSDLFLVYTERSDRTGRRAHGPPALLQGDEGDRVLAAGTPPPRADPPPVPSTRRRSRPAAAGIRSLHVVGRRHEDVRAPAPRPRRSPRRPWSAASAAHAGASRSAARARSGCPSRPPVVSPTNVGPGAGAHRQHEVLRGREHPAVLQNGYRPVEAPRPLGNDGGRDLRTEILVAGAALVAHPAVHRRTLEEAPRRRLGLRVRAAAVAAHVDHERLHRASPGARGPRPARPRLHRTTRCAGSPSRPVASPSSRTRSSTWPNGGRRWSATASGR